jgi:uncharacterized protein (DUF2252 family)
MSHTVDAARMMLPQQRQQHVVDTLADAFAELIAADPAAFRRKFRKMAADPFSFYRGSACLFYADVVTDDDPFANDHTSRVWIQGDLHAQNFGTYMNSDGVLVFDVNDFDEAYLGHFTWDVKRMATSLSLLGYAKAFSDADIAALIGRYARSYAEQVRRFATTDEDSEFALRLDTTTGPVRDALRTARCGTRVSLLDRNTVIEDYDRVFRTGPEFRQLDPDERAVVEAAFEEYLITIPKDKRQPRVSYNIKDIVGRSGFGIGSAGLPAYNVLLEGHTQALENDIILSLKQANVAAPSRVVTDERIRRFFRHHGHRTAVSQRALQAHADPWLGFTEVDGVGFVVAELSAYQADLDWDAVGDVDEAHQVLTALGQATAKVHCVADSEADQTLVPFSTEAVITAAIGEDMEAFVDHVVEFGLAYGEVARDDYRLFVDAFRNGQLAGV